MIFEGIASASPNPINHINPIKKISKNQSNPVGGPKARQHHRK
jgi:hypothetical protein